MFKFLLVVQALVTLAMIVVILMQRSEGGGLGMGGSPSGLMSARGAADFLTRATTVLATLFIILSMILAGLATRNHTSSTIDTSLSKGVSAPVTTPTTGTTGVPLQGGAPAADSLEATKANAASQNIAPAEKAPAAENKGGVPLQK